LQIIIRCNEISKFGDKMTDYNKKDDKDKKYAEKPQTEHNPTTAPAKDSSKTSPTREYIDKQNQGQIQSGSSGNQNKKKETEEKQPNYKYDKSAAKSSFNKNEDKESDVRDSKGDEDERGEDDKPIDQNEPGFKMADKKSHYKNLSGKTGHMGESSGGTGSSAYMDSDNQNKLQYESDDKQKYGSEKPIDSYKKPEDKKHPKKDERPIDEQ
jgi:hypothetical protein